MASTKLYCQPLSEAIDSLQRAIAQPKDEFIRDSVIQRFEYTYELSWKLLKRYLEDAEGVVQVDHLSRKDLFRLAAEKGILDDPQAWFEFHIARNETSHTYNESKAEAVYQVALRFLSPARALLEELKKHEHD